MLPDCNKPLNEGKIARHIKAYMEKGGGKVGNKEGGNIRKKWTKDSDGGGGGGYQINNNSNHGNGIVQMMGNKWM